MNWLFLGPILFASLFLVAIIIVCCWRDNAFLQKLADDANNPEVADERIEYLYFKDLLQNGGLALKACRILKFCDRQSLATKLATECQKRLDAASVPEAEEELSD